MVASAEGVTPHEKEGSGHLEGLFCSGSGFNVEEEEEISLVRTEGWDLVLFSSMVDGRWMGLPTGWVVFVLGLDWIGFFCLCRLGLQISVEYLVYAHMEEIHRLGCQCDGKRLYMGASCWALAVLGGRTLDDVTSLGRENDRKTDT